MNHVKQISVTKASTNPDGAGSAFGIGIYLWGIVFFLKEWFE